MDSDEFNFSPLIRVLWVGEEGKRKNWLSLCHTYGLSLELTFCCHGFLRIKGVYIGYLLLETDKKTLIYWPSKYNRFLIGSAKCSLPLFAY